MKIKEMPKYFGGIEYAANDKHEYLTLIGDFDYEWGCERDVSEELADGYWEDTEWGVRIKSGKGVAIRTYAGGCLEYFSMGISISEAERLIREEGRCWFKNLGPAISVADHNDPDPMHNNHF